MFKKIIFILSVFTLLFTATVFADSNTCISNMPTDLRTLILNDYDGKYFTCRYGDTYRIYFTDSTKFTHIDSTHVSQYDQNENLLTKYVQVYFDSNSNYLSYEIRDFSSISLYGLTDISYYTSPSFPPPELWEEVTPQSLQQMTQVLLTDSSIILVIGVVILSILLGVCLVPRLVHLFL